MCIRDRLKKKKLSPIYIDPLAIAGIFTAVLMMISMVAGIAQLRSAHREKAEMERYIQRLTTENAALQETYEQGYDLDEIREMALAIGMVEKDRVPNRVISVTVPVEESPTPSVWSRIGTFLAGLFA